MTAAQHTPGPKVRLTSNQVHVLQWFAAREWVLQREWRAEMTTATPRSLRRHGLLDVRYTPATTHYRINDAGRAAIAKAEGGAPHG